MTGWAAISKQATTDPTPKAKDRTIVPNLTKFGTPSLISALTTSIQASTAFKLWMVEYLAGHAILSHVNAGIVGDSALTR
jgi:hypothetical protein